MTQIFSVKSAAMLCVAAVAMTFSGAEADAQCPYGGRGVAIGSGFGGTSISIGYSSGFRGIGGLGYSNFGPAIGGFGPVYGPNFGRGVSVNLYRPPVPRSYYGGGFYGGGGYGRSYYGGRGYGHGHGHRHGHRGW